MGVIPISVGSSDQPFSNLEALSVRDAARSYIASGYRPIPLQPLGKKPKDKEWPNLAITEEEVDAKFDEKDNVGLLLANGLIDVDLDSPEALRLAHNFLPTCSCIFGRNSRPGSHRLYRSHQDLKPKVYAAGASTYVEIRTGKLQTRVPPSRDADGESVRFEQGAWELPTFVVVSDLELRVRELAIACVLLRLWPAEKGVRHKLALAAAGWLLRGGLKADRVTFIIMTVAREAGDEEFKDRAQAVSSTVAKLKHGGEVTGLPHLVDLTGAQADLAAANKWLDEANGHAEVTKSTRPPLSALALSAPDFLKQIIPPREEFVSPWLKRGSSNLLYSVPKVGKTWFVLLLATCLAAGHDLLHWEVPGPRSVLLVDGEMGDADLQNRLSLLRISPTERLGILTSEQASEAGGRINIMSERDQAWITDYIKDGSGPDVLILDNLGSLAQGWDENDNSSPELDRFKSWLLSLRERGIAVLLVHHCGHDGRHPRGASGLFAIMNTVIRLSREGDGGDCAFTVGFEQVRDSRPNPDKFSVRLRSIEGKVELVVGGPSVSQSEMRLLKELWKESCTTQKELAHTLNMSTANVSTIIKGMVERGLVIRKKPIAVLTKKGGEVVEASEFASKALVQFA